MDTRKLVTATVTTGLGQEMFAGRRNDYWGWRGWSLRQNLALDLQAETTGPAQSRTVYGCRICMFDALYACRNRCPRSVVVMLISRRSHSGRVEAHSFVLVWFPRPRRLVCE